MKQYLRKRKHVRFIRCYIMSLHWDTINIIVATKEKDWTESTVSRLQNNGYLIRKYERRKRWLLF